MPGDDTSTYAPKSPDFSSIFAAPGPTQSQSPNPSTQAYQHSPQQHHQHQQHFHQPSPQQQQQQPPHHPHHQQPPHNPQPGQDYSLDPSAYGGYIPPPYGSHHSPSAYHNPPPLKSEYQEHFPPDQYLSPNQPPHPHYPPQPQHPGLYGQQQQPVYHQQPPLYGQPAFQEQPLFPGQDPYAQQQPPYHHPPGGGFPSSPGAQIKAEHEAVQSNMPPRRTAAQPAPVIDPSPVRTKFPTARIKRIMQADEEVGKVAQQTPIAVGKALEMFMVQLVSKSADIAKEKGSKRVTAHMLKQVVETDEQWDFLRDIVSKVENEKEGAKAKAKAESDSEEEEAAETKKRGRGGRRKKA